MKKRDKLYKHVEINVVQASKRPGEVCGDVVVQERTPEATTIIVCDGVGSGIKANIAATMAASRIMELLRKGFSLRDTFRNLASSMHAARTSSIPFAAFAVARILNEGSATILTFEMPPPIIVEKYWAYVPQQRFFTLANEIIGEVHCTIKPEDSVLLMSDGVTQAGLGQSLRGGWTAQGATSFLNKCLAERIPLTQIPEKILDETYRLSGDRHGDDTTIALLTTRPGTTVHILSGPPSNKKDDQAVISALMESDGIKVVCGSTTAEVVARCLGKQVNIEGDIFDTGFSPPQYSIEGVNLVTEGTITLTQVYNILDEQMESLPKKTGVGKLCYLLKAADRIYFTVGKTTNPGHDDITFRQMGILPRSTIIPLIAEKLKKAGKLVVVNYI